MLFMTFSQNTQDFAYIITNPPGSLFFIMVLSTIVAFISTGLTRLLIDTDELNRKQKLIRAHNEDKMQIIKLAETNPEKYRKDRKRWERKDVMLKKTQQRIGLQRLKPTCITFVPMIVIFAILRGIYETDPVACTAMNANDLPLLGGIVAAFNDTTPITAGWINFTAWYFLCSLGINTTLQRLLKIQTQASGGMDQMFKGQKAQSMQFPDI